VARKLVIDQPRRAIQLNPRFLEVTKPVIAADREGRVQLALIISCRVEISRLPQRFSAMRCAECSDTVDRRRSGVPRDSRVPRCPCSLEV
jgi:hypothetical protein